MGADLYIDSLYNPNHEHWSKPFDEAVRRRDALKEGTPAHEEAQREVHQYFERMNAIGYFRDSYNDASLLSTFDLSWWTDVIPLCDEQGILTPAGAVSFLQLLKAQEQVFESNTFAMGSHERQYFIRKYTLLRDFLNQAIDLNEPIHASL